MPGSTDSRCDFQELPLLHFSKGNDGFPFFCTGELSRTQCPREHSRLINRRIVSGLLRVFPHLPKNPKKNGSHRPAI